MSKILIYSNCHGGKISHMLQKHEKTSMFTVSYISNFEELKKERISPEHLSLVQECDYFIYQPFNKTFSDSEYDVEQIKACLKPSCVVFRINYYRFKGFYYQSHYKPFTQHGIYKFLGDREDFGLHNSFEHITTTDKQEIKTLLDTMEIREDYFQEYFQRELERFHMLDTKSDVQMYSFFLKHYQTKKLFQDCFHPTNFFFYEIFRQTVLSLFDIVLPEEDDEFIRPFGEMITWSQPILPKIQHLLGMNIPSPFQLFDGCFGEKTVWLDVYDYYYIRLSHDNFDTFLEEYSE